MFTFQPNPRWVIFPTLLHHSRVLSIHPSNQSYQFSLIFLICFIDNLSLPFKGINHSINKQFSRATFLDWIGNNNGFFSAWTIHTLSFSVHISRLRYKTCYFKSKTKMTSLKAKRRTLKSWKVWAPILNHLRLFSLRSN